MKKDEISPEELGKIFFKIFKTDLGLFPKIIEGIEKIADEEKENLDKDKISEELLYLHVYGYYQVINGPFKSHFIRFEKDFRKELEDYLEESKSAELALTTLIRLHDALIFYTDKYNETIAREPNRKKGLMDFSFYVAKRILGNELGSQIPYAMYMMSVYGGIFQGLSEIINSSIELAE